ncbi:MAG TPA: hypothetical protein VN858_12055, partial [Casimicrobiaceae bacterium]|nr:hypothetical protein [Casimicrobiaceae bacterium]
KARRSNLPNLAEDIAPHKQKTGICYANPALAAFSRRRSAFDAKPMPYGCGRAKRRGAGHVS